MKCEICGANANVHYIEYDGNGNPAKRHRCDAHKLNNLPQKAQSMDDLKKGISRVREFLVKNRRVPTNDELNAMGLQSHRGIPTTLDVDEFIRELDDILKSLP
jgi:hypothetical protein